MDVTRLDIKVARYNRGQIYVLAEEISSRPLEGSLEGLLEGLLEGRKVRWKIR